MSIRDLLRGLPVLAHEMPPFDPADTPDAPVPLFASWLAGAIAAGVDEPHAMTLSTVDADGAPDARVLILKDLDDEGWSFATASTSAKGRQLVAEPQVALSFHWREQGRQVRVRGVARPADPEVSRRDFLARPLGSRIATMAGRQSEPLDRREALDGAFARARALVLNTPDLAPEAHTVYLVRPETVEFWQADRERRHVRLRYRRAGEGWERELLWP